MKVLAFLFCALAIKHNDRLDVRFLTEHKHFVFLIFHKKGNQECWEVQSKLNRLLELIALDDGSLVRVQTEKGEKFIDNVLHFL